MATVYVILNLRTKWFYVGSTDNFGARKYRHTLDLMQGRHHCVRLQKSWLKYEPDSFVFKIVAKNVSRVEASRVEQALLDDTQYRSKLYNTSLSAVYGNTLGNHPQRDKLIQKRTEAYRAWLSSLTAEKRKELWSKPGEANGMYGKTHTKAVKRKLSELMIGNSRAKGAVRSAEHRARLSEVASTRTGNFNTFYGKSHSKATKAKLRKQMLGRKPVNLRPIKAEGKLYDSVSSAARALDVTPNAICYRLRNEWVGYKYLDINA